MPIPSFEDQSKVIQSNVDFWFRWLLNATYLVAVGVLLEGLEHFTSAKKRLGEVRLHEVEKLGWWLVLIGVVCEGGFDWRMAHFEDTLRDLKDRHVSEIARQTQANEKSVADANERTARANERASNNEHETARLTAEGNRLIKAAEDERLARVQLEASIAPRRITPSQQSAISKELSKFSGRSARVVTYSLDLEGSILGEQILISLTKAGIQVENEISGFNNNQRALCSAVHVSGNDKELVEAATKALNVIGGLASYANPDLTCRVSGPKPSLDILVGVKPIAMAK